MSGRKRSSDTVVVSQNDSLAPVSRLRVSVKRIHAVGRWTWNANDDVCGICQSAYEGTAPNVRYPGEDCPVVWGRCGHAYHLQCLSTWLSTSKNTCPLCRQEWEFGQNPTVQTSSNDEQPSNNDDSDATVDI